MTPPRRDIILAATMYLLNLFDMGATLFFVGGGHAAELNPGMRMFMMLGQEWFIFYKVAVVGLLTFFLLVIRIPRRLNNALLFLTGVYFAITMYHVLGALFLE